jgi:hypothetical protein
MNEADCYTDRICEDIFHLSGTLKNLLNLDSSLLGEQRRDSLKRMKQVIFDTLELYVMSVASDATIDNDEEIQDEFS